MTYLSHGSTVSLVVPLNLYELFGIPIIFMLSAQVELVADCSYREDLARSMAMSTG